MSAFISPAALNGKPDLEAAQTVDARGLPCPQPLLALRRALSEAPGGTLLRVMTTDPASWRDFHSFAELSGQPLVHAEQRGEVFSYWISKREP